MRSSRETDSTLKFQANEGRHSEDLRKRFRPRSDMKNVVSNKAKTNQERGNDILHRFTQARDVMEDRKGRAIEYFVTKLKRVDDEMLVSCAELREINEEISVKLFEIERLKMKLENLMREETNREITRLEQMKRELKENVKKADRVLAGLGLIWVGEHSSRPNEDLGVRIIASPEGSYYRPDPGYHEITNQQSPVTPFSGHGYRLGTGSEIFAQQANASDVHSCSGQTNDNTSPSGKYSVGDTTNAGSSLRDSPRYGLSQTSSDNRIRQVDALGSTRIKSLEELPLEFRLMSKSEKRRALKQVGIQIQKNMNKYTI